MKALLLSFFTLIALNSFAQEEWSWIKHDFDQYLSVDVPDNMEVADTLGQKIITATTDDAVVMVQKVPNVGEIATSINSKEHLIEQYKSFLDGVLEEGGGTLLSQDYFQKNGLEMTKFSIDVPAEEQKRHYVVTFLDNSWYAVQFWELGEGSENFTTDSERLFSSIEFKPGLSITNQLTTTGKNSEAYRMGYKIGKLIAWPLLLGVVIAIAYGVTRFFNRKKKKDDFA